MEMVGKKTQKIYAITCQIQEWNYTWVLLFQLPEVGQGAQESM